MVPSVFLCCPCKHSMARETAVSCMTASRRVKLEFSTRGTSLLGLSFNLAWCEALNRREELDLTHFAMIHSDVAAEPGWLDKLIDLMTEHQADVLSVVLPICDGRGLTSTGTMDPHTGQVTRFTMRELEEMPATFGTHDVDRSSQAMAVNTGLWLCDFTQDWVESVCFAVQDAIYKTPDGIFQPRNMPEDWAFSLKCHGALLKVMATRAVKATHFGRYAYRNDEFDGGLEHEPGGELVLEGVK